MPPRLSHRKSRAGCRRCKERKVKCTEEHPSCAACLRHGVPCKYEDGFKSSTLHESRLPPSRTVSRGTSEQNVATATTTGPTTTTATTSTVSPPSGLDSPYSDVVDSLTPEPLRHHIELYLLHRFKSSVAASFPSAQMPLLKNIYVWDACEGAFDHPYLLNAIFAITALYLWMQETIPVDEIPTVVTPTLPASLRGVNFAHLHRVYLNLAISQERAALSTIGPSSADALGMTCIMLSLMATCLLTDAPSGTSGEGDDYMPPIQWLTMAKGNETVFKAAHPHLREGAIMLYLRASSEPNFRDSSRLFHPQNAAPFARILEYRSSESDAADDPYWHHDFDPTNRDAYRDTLAYIGSVYEAVRASEPPHYICLRCVAFATFVPRPLVGLLAHKSPRALVVLAQILPFLKYSDSYWWFKGRAEKEMAGIQSVVPGHWHWALRWPLAVLAAKENVKLDPRDFYDAVHTGT